MPESYQFQKLKTTRPMNTTYHLNRTKGRRFEFGKLDYFDFLEKRRKEKKKNPSSRSPSIMHIKTSLIDQKPF